MVMLKPLLVFAACATVGCGGGFYDVANTPDLKEPDDTAVEIPSYLTMVVELQNAERLKEPGFADERDGKLSHLYIHASFKPPGESQNVSIPLLLLDLTNNSLETTQGQHLIRKLPLRPNAREPLLLRIESEALKTTDLDLVFDVWKKADGLVSTAAGMTGSVQILGAINLLGTFLSRYRSGKYSRRAELIVPTDYTGARFTQVFFIVPTHVNGAVVPQMAEKREWIKSNGSVCELRNKQIRVCAGGKEYTELPYIIMTAKLSSWLDDLQLISPRISANCTELSALAVERAESHLRSLGPHDLSDDQRAEEEDLLARAQLLTAIRGELAAKSFAKAIDSYSRFNELARSNSTLYQQHYKVRTEKIDGCVKSAMRKVLGSDQIFAVSELMAKQMNFTGMTLQALETEMVQFMAFVGTPDRASELNFFRDTMLFARAGVRRDMIARVMYAQFYQNLIADLQGGSDAAQESARTLEKQLKTACGVCRDEASKALSEYKSRLPKASGAPLELERTRTLNSAAKLRTDLFLMYSAQGSAGREEQRLTNQIAAIDNLQVQLIAAEKESLKSAVDALKDQIDAASTLLKQTDRGVPPLPDSLP